MIRSARRPASIGQLRPSPDGHHLVDENGRPFFWLGDTAWELFHRLDREDAIRYLDDRAAKGFTVIQAVAHGRIKTGWATAPNRYGHPPYVDGDPARPDSAYFGHVDWVVERALERGIRTALLPFWGNTAVVHASAVTAENAQEHGRWFGERYRDHGIIWVLGGDIGPVWYGPRPLDNSAGRSNRRLIDYRPVYDAMADGIRSAAGADAMLTYHPTAGAPETAPRARASLYFADRPWVKLSLLQSGHIDAATDIVDEHGGFRRAMSYPDGSKTFANIWSGPFAYVPIGEEYHSDPPRPVIDGEPCYEDHPRWRDASYDRGMWSAADVRAAAYHALFAGAAGHTYGHVSVWDFYGSGGLREEYPSFPEGFRRPIWTDALDAPGASQMSHVRSLIESRPPLYRIPDDAMIHGLQVRGSAHISATRDRSGAYAYLYLPRGGEVTVDLDSLSGSGPVWWFNPRNGVAHRAGTHSGAQRRAFRAPSSGLDHDWVLVLDDAAHQFGAPGRA